MFSFNLVSWLKSIARTRGKTIQKKPRFRLSVETLEDRLAPATFIWTGGGANTNWSTAANWQGGIAPSAASPLADLVFDNRGAGSLISNNNINNLTVNSIQIANLSNYTLTGNQITLGNPGAAGSGTILVASGLTGTDIGLPMQLSAASGSKQFITVGAAGVLTLSGALTGNTGSEITKEGTGTLILSNNNSGFNGPFNLDHDAGIVRIQHARALGSGLVTVGNNSQLQIDANGAASLPGGSIPNTVQLFGPGVSNLGSLYNLDGANTWSGDIEMATDTSFNAAANTTLTITGNISDLSSPFNVTKIGQGEVIFASQNDYRGSTTVNDGILTIRNPLALGSVPGAGTTVNRNAILGTIGTLRLWATAAQQASAEGGFTVADVPLTLNATGFGGNGALNNFEGNNTWTGPVTLGSPGGFAPTIRVEANAAGDDTRLFLKGVISDVIAPNTPFDLTKTGTGDLVLQPTNAFGVGTPNQFRGTTTVVEGTLTLRDSQGLGPQTKQNRLNWANPIATILDGATLALESNVGHVDSVTGTVNRLDVAAPINIDGAGLNGVGALRSVSGINTYSSVFFTSPVQGATNPQPGGALTNGTTYYYVVTAIDGFGESLPSNEQSYQATAANRTARISWAAVPGATGYRIYRSTTPGSYGASSRVTTINSGATVTFNDPGAATGAGSPPARFAVIRMFDLGPGASIGVEAEPTQTADISYFTDDYSLTVTGGIGGLAPQIMTKVGTGHLILPNANIFLESDTAIDNGWVTIRNPDALGPPLDDVQEVQPEVTVNTGAALMFYPLEPGTNFTFSHNLDLQGTGISHPFALINQKGALENLSGVNTIDGNMAMTNKVGIGVEKVFGPSHLSLKGEQTENPVTAININANFNGGSNQNARVVDTGSLTGGTIILNADVYGREDDLRVYLGDWVSSPGTAILVYDSSTNLTPPYTTPYNPVVPTNTTGADINIVYDNTTAIATATHVLGRGFPGGPKNTMGTGWQLGPVNSAYAALPSTFITIVVNQGGNPLYSMTSWEYALQILPNSSNIGGQIVKLGSQRLDIVGPGIYSGGVDIREGVVQVENNDALGRPGAGAAITVQPGASLALAPIDPAQHGGLNTGASIWDTRLTLAGNGNSEFGLAPLTVLSDDVLWYGPVSLISTVNVTFEGALANQAVPTLTGDGAGLTGGSPTVTVVTTTPGGPGRNAVQTLGFAAGINGGTFTLTYDDGINPPVTTGNIAWDADPNTLFANMRAELTGIAALAGNFDIALMSPTIEIKPNSRLVIAGAINDGTPSTPGVYRSDINISGGGQLLLSGPNTYRGTTFVHQGVVTVANGQALGDAGVPGQQEISFNGAIAGSTKYTLAFAGEPTPEITYTGAAADAVNIQTALNNLTAIGGSGASVSVIPASPGVFLVTFSGNLTGNTSQLIVAAITSGPGDVLAGVQGGTVIADQAQIQMQGGITVSGEPLILQGTGNNLQSAQQSFTTSSTTLVPTGDFTLEFNGDTTGPLTFDSTASDIQDALQGLPSIGGAGGTVTVNVGNVVDGANEIQRIAFTNFNVGDRYRLYFDPTGATPALGRNLTPLLTYSANPFTNRFEVMYELKRLDSVVRNGGTVQPGPTGVVAGGGSFVSVEFLGSFANQPLPEIVPFNFTAAPGSAIAVTQTQAAAPGSKSYTVGFSGSFAHQAQPLLTVATTGTTTVSTPVTTIAGGTQNATPDRWFETGPAPITAAEVFNGGGGGPQLTTGRITGVVVQGTYADDILISTAGGGFWKTIDGGRHWTPMFDGVPDSVLFGGSIATLASPAPNLIYMATGEGNNSADSFYGSGVYLNGTLLTDPVLDNPLAGKAVNKIVVNPNNPLMIWVAVSDLATNGTSGDAGVWRYDGINWVNITDDGVLPTDDVSYTDLAYDSINDVLYAGILNPTNPSDNDIITSTDPTSALPTWTAEDIESIITGASGPANRVGSIKLAVAQSDRVYAAVADRVTGGILSILETNTGPGGFANVADVSFDQSNLPNYLLNQGSYASAIVARGNTIYVGGRDQGNGTDFVLQSTDRGANWTDIVAGAAAGPHTGIHGLALDVNNQLVVGSDGGLWRWDPAGPTWTNLNGDLGISQINAVTAQPGNNGLLLAGTQNNSAARSGGTQAWTQVNPNAAAPTASVTSIDFVPGNPTQAFAIVNGTFYHSSDGGTTWTANGAAADFAIDLINPSRVLLSNAAGSVRESNNAGAGPLTNLNSPAGGLVAAASYQGIFRADPYFPAVQDVGANTYVPGTIYVASTTNLFVSKNYGTLWTGTTLATSVRTPPLLPGTTIRDIAVDPADSNVIYVVTSGAVGVAGAGRVFKSTDAGLSWTPLSTGLPLSTHNGSVLAAWNLAIDYRTNDLYLGTDEGVWKLAGGTGAWQRFGAGLPNVQVKDIHLDPATNVLTAGTYGRGVWQFYLDDNTLPTAPASPGVLRSVAGDNVWAGPIYLAGATTVSANGSQALQNGLSAASLTLFGSVSDLTITSLNTLTKIGGGDVILSGVNSFAGVTDVQEGNVVVRNPQALGSSSFAGVQALSVFATQAPVQDVATVTTGGAIPDATTYYYQITAIGPRGESIGSNQQQILTTADNQAVILTWRPVAGATQYNVYRSTNPVPFASPALVATVNSGSATTYTDLGAATTPGAPTPLTINLSFDGVTTATPLNYTGTAADAAAIEAALNGLSSIASAGTGASVSVVETSPGLYLITFQGSLAGITAPTIQASIVGGFGSASVTTGAGGIVQKGAALVLQSSLDLEPLTLNGNGINPNYGGHYTGALRSLTNTNTYTGTATLNTNATIGVDASSTLIMASANAYSIIDNGVGYNLTKEGAGTLILTSASNYAGANLGTFVNQGVLNIQDSGALGAAAGTTTIRDGAQLQLQEKATGPNQLAPSLSAGGTIANGTTYYYQITAITATGETLPSNEVTITTDANDQAIDLDWNSVAGAISYKVYRSTTPAPYTSPALLAIVTTGSAFTDDGTIVLGPGTPPVGPLDVADQNLVLSGTGIAGSGALLNVRGNNTWGSTGTTVTITSAPAFFPNTTPKGTVSFGVTRAADTLTIGSSINEPTSAAAAPTTGPLPTGLTKVGQGRLTLTQADAYSGTTYVDEGILRIQNNDALGTGTDNEIQRITVFDTVGTSSYTLSFNGQTTGLLPFGLQASGGVGATASVQNALEALSSIGNGNVSVTRSTITVSTPSGDQVGYIYTVTFTFSGPQLHANVPLMTATPSGGINIAISQVADGGIGTIVSSGASLEIDGTLADLTVPASESLFLNGTGVAGLGALHNVGGSNLWNGPVTLQTSSRIGVDPSSQLNIVGAVQDLDLTNAIPSSPLPSPIPQANLTKVGDGTLVFPNAKTYTGNTFINEGVLNIRNSQALGLQPSEVQNVTVTGTSGSFTLNFKGDSTGSLPFGTPASGGVGPLASIQNALNALPSISTGGGSVIVTQTGNTYTVFFNGGPLARTNQPILSGTFTAGITTFAIAPIQKGGSSSTVVADGATLQLQSTTEATAKQLILNGLGFDNAGALQNVLGNNIAKNQSILLGSDASFGAEAGTRLTVNLPTSDQYQVQSITFNGFSGGNTYTLSFNGDTTPPLVFSSTASTNRTRIANALNALPTIALLGGSVTVSSVGNTYSVSFGGRMIGTAWTQIVATRTSGTGTFNVSTAMSSYGYGITKLGDGTVRYDGTVNNLYTGLTHVVEGLLELNQTASTNAIAGDLTVGTPGTPEIQTLTVSGTSGTFTLSFNGQTTTDLDFDATNIEVRNALNALSTIGNVGGSVAVVKTGNVYTITFGGTLLGANLQTLGVDDSGGATASITAETDGGRFSPAAGVVARLLTNNQIVNTSNVLVHGDGLLDLNGLTEDFNRVVRIVDGQMDTGATGAAILLAGLNMTGGTINDANAASPGGLDLQGNVTAISTATGSAVIQGAGVVNLHGATRTFTVNDGPQHADLFVPTNIADLSGSSGLVKNGNGRLELSAHNAYVGATTISNGDVQVDGSGIVQVITLRNVIANTTRLTLTYQGATAVPFLYTGNSATDVASFQSAIGFLLSVPASSVNVVADGTGTIFTVTFTVARSPFMPAVTTAATTGNAYLTIPNNIQDVYLDGGSLSGTGSVDLIAGAPAGTTAAVGTVDPGVNTLVPTAGMLNTTGNVLWGPNTTFQIQPANLTGTHPNPIAGRDYEQLSITGSITLGNALLTGSPGPGILIDDEFTIIQASAGVFGFLNGIDPISGSPTQINQDGTVWLNGQKFTVHYYTNSVVLTRELAVMSVLDLTVNANPSAYGQEVIYTVHAVPEPGATFATADVFMDFTLDGPQGLYTQSVAVNTTTGLAVFMPQAQFGLVFAPTNLPSIPPHTVTATLRDANAVFAVQTPPQSPITQTINKGVVNLTLDSSPAVTATTPVYSQDVDVIATLLPQVVPNVAGADNPTGTVTFIVDGSAAMTYIVPIDVPGSSPPNSETATRTLFGNLFLAPGLHTVTASYNGDTNYAASATPTSFSLIVRADNTAVTIVPTPSSSNLGQLASFAVTVNPATSGTYGTPIGTVDIFDGTTKLNPSPIAYNGSTITFATSSLLIGAHTIRATFTPTNANYIGSTNTINFTVTTATTATSFVSVNPSGPTYGQAVTATMRVIPSPSIASTFGLPTGQIELRLNSQTGPLLSAPGAVNAGTGVAVVNIPAFALPVGAHTLYAIYTGNTQFGTSVGTFNINVTPAVATVALTASPANTAPYAPNTTINLHAVVSAVVGGLPTGAGSTVTFFNQTTGAQIGAPVNVTTGGIADTSVASNTFAAGVNVITATYTDASGNYVNLVPGTINYTITNAPTVTNVVADLASGTAVFGQDVQLTATVTSPGGSVPIGAGSSVRFTDTTTNTVLGIANIQASGPNRIAVITTNILTAASHNIIAVYTNTVNNFFATSTGNLNSYVVNRADTVIDSLTSSKPISGAGEAVTFTAQVLSQSPSTATVNAGSVTFFDTFGVNTVTLGTGVVNAFGIATYTTTSAQMTGIGDHTITAQYNLSANFNASAPSDLLTQTVLKATTTSAVPNPMSPIQYGSSIDLTITVSGIGGGIPSGNVTIIDTTTNTTWGPVGIAPVSGTQAGVVFNIPDTLTLGTHSLTVTYNGDLNFAPSTIASNLNLVINPSMTTTTITVFPTTAAYGDTLDYTATVTANSGFALDYGTVTFKDTKTNTILGTDTLSGSNVATISVMNLLKPGVPHSIVAIYNDNVDAFFQSSTSAPKALSVTKAATSVNLDSSAPGGSFFGNPVTFTATVDGGPAGPPTGFVTFKNGATILKTVAVDGSGVAEFTTNPKQLLVGSLNITAKYTGNVNFAASPIATLVQDVAKAGTQTVLGTSHATGSIYGQVVTFTATIGVTTGGAPGIPNGTVTFRDGGAFLATVTLVNGVATYKTGNLSAATHNITADYNGTGRFAISDDALSQDVAQATTTVTLNSTPVVWAINKPTQFKAVVTGNTAKVPTGTVTFTVNGPGGTTVLPAVTLVGGKANSAPYNFPDGMGSYTVTADYTPANGNFAADTVSRTETVLNFTKATISSVSTADGANLYAKITSTTTGGTPSGVVDFYEIVAGVKVLLGQGTLNANGVAMLFAPLSAAQHKIYVEYPGDGALFNPASATATVYGRLTGRLV